MSKYSTKLLGFGDNVVDIYDHQKTMYPGGNCVNVSVYGKMSGCEKTAYMGYFGDDEEAELVIDALKKNGVETVKCRQLHGENGYSRITLMYHISHTTNQRGTDCPDFIRDLRHYSLLTRWQICFGVCRLVV